MGYLEKQASRFRKNGRMGSEDMEEIIKELSKKEGTGGLEDRTETARISEHEAVKEAIDK